MIRGIRGAISVSSNTKAAILQATRELLEEIIRANKTNIEEVVGVFFTATQDLDAVYPAQAARELGWTHTALMCMQEMEVLGSLRQCIRVLILWDTCMTAQQVKHIYLGEARCLRPDLLD